MSLFTWLNFSILSILLSLKSIEGEQRFNTGLVTTSLKNYYAFDMDKSYL